MDEWKVRGTARTVRREHAEWDVDRGAWGPPRSASSMTFREDGQVSHGESRNADGSISRWARVYDDRGRLIEARSWMDDGPRTRVLHAYDAQGRSTVALEVESDGTRRQVETCEYDSAGRKTKISLLPAPHGVPMMYGVEGTEHAFGAPGATTLAITYDERDLPVEGVFHDAIGAAVRRIVFSRDDKGRVLSEVVYLDAEFPFPDMTSAAPDAPVMEREQLAALMKVVFADQVFCRTDYAYDPAGRLLERTMRMGALHDERTTFEYNDHDDPVSEIQATRRRGMGLEDGAARTREEEPLGHRNRFEYQVTTRTATGPSASCGARLDRTGSSSGRSSSGGQSRTTIRRNNRDVAETSAKES